MSGGPLRQVLDAFASGCGSLAEVADHTGLDSDSVRTATDHLVRIGRLAARPLSVGCPGGSCTSCTTGCLPGANRGPALITLSVPPS